MIRAGCFDSVSCSIYNFCGNPRNAKPRTPWNCYAYNMSFIFFQIVTRDPFHPSHLHLSSTLGLALINKSGNVKQGLKFLDQHPLVIRDIVAIELLERINALATDERVEGIFFFEMSTIGRLVRAHFNLDSHRWLPLLADLDLLMIAFDRSPANTISTFPN